MDGNVFLTRLLLWNVQMELEPEAFNLLFIFIQSLFFLSLGKKHSIEMNL